MSVKDSLKVKLASAITAATLITSPGTFAEDNVNADLASHNKTTVTQQDKKPMHLELPSDVPLKNARVMRLDNYMGSPLTQTYFLTKMQGNMDFSKEMRRRAGLEVSEGNSEVVLLVVKGGNKAANARYEHAIHTMARNVSNAFTDPQAQVDAVVGVHPEEGRTHNGKSPSGGILMYINDHAVIGHFPEDFSNEALLENIRTAQTYLIHTFEENLHKMDREQLGEYLDGQQQENVVNGAGVNRGRGDTSSSGDSGSQNDAQSIASLDM